MPTEKPPPPTMEQLARYAAAFNNSRALQHHHLKISFPSLDRVVADLDPIQDEQRGGLGTDAVNGGVLAAIFDLSIGCTPALIDPTRRTATISLQIHFERPVRGTRLRAEAKVDRAGGSTIFASAWIMDEAGTVCARCQGISRMGSQPWDEEQKY